MMKKVKSNPYVYPYVPFYDLSDKYYYAKFSEGKTLNIVDLKRYTKKYKNQTIKPKGKTNEEKILNVFLNTEILFGPKEYVIKDKDKWLESFSYFISQKKPVQLSILGFPFKMPIPLKTDRTTPDMGEVLMINKLYNIAKNISYIYKPGARITIFTEGVFGRYNHIPEKEYKRYFRALRKINRSLGFDKYIKLVELEEMEKLTKNFNVTFKKKVDNLSALVKKKDRKVLKKLCG